MSGLLRVLTALACAAVCVLAQAQGYPAKTVRLVYPIAAGGGIDALVRTVSQRLSEALGQPVVVENKPGAGGIVGTEYVARSAPDGYTLLVSSPTLVISPILYSKLPYDPFKDFAPITQLIAMNQVVVVNSTLHVKNLRELIDLAKTKPGVLNYASFGIGSSAHLVMEMFQAMAGIKLNHVPYKGGAQALADVIAGQVQITYGTFGVMSSQWKAGKVRVLAVDGARRLAQYPDVPTVAETLPGFESTSWIGLLAPAGTPREAINRITAEVRKILTDPAFREKSMDLQGLEPIVSSPEQFAEYIKSEALKWSKVVRDAKVALD